jgi:hypothetical protein
MIRALMAVVSLAVSAVFMNGWMPFDLIEPIGSSTKRL